MICPDCKAKTVVKESRTKGGDIHRRRWCPNGHKFTTKEILVRHVKAIPVKKKQVPRHEWPLTRLSDSQAKIARDMFRAGWTARDVAPMFDLTVQELRL